MFAEIRKKYLQLPLLLPFVVHTVGNGQNQNAVNRPEGSHCHHLLMVAEGEGIFSVGGERFTLSAGEGIFCRSGVPHAYRPCGEIFRTCWVTFLGAESVLDYYGIKDYFYFKADSLLFGSTKNLEQFCMGNSTVLTRSAAGYSWFTDWLHGCFAPSAPITVQVRRYLEVHFAEPLTLDQIAEAVHMSRYALCHHYKEVCGITVMEQLRKIRIEKAKQMLRLSNTSVEEIGKNCGFESASYFGLLFRKETGHTPKEYRNK